MRRRELPRAAGVLCPAYRMAWSARVVAIACECGRWHTETLPEPPAVGWRWWTATWCVGSDSDADDGEESRGHHASRREIRAVVCEPQWRPEWAYGLRGAYAHMISTEYARAGLALPAGG